MCLGFASRGGPFARAGASVPAFGSVIETVCSFAGFAAEGEEIELIAVGVLAVRTDGVEVFVHGCEGLGVAWGACGGCHGGRGVYVWAG